MGRRPQLRWVLIVALVAGSVACGSGNSVTLSEQTTTTTRTERTAVDGVIDHIVRSQAVLSPTSGGTTGETIVQMMVTSRDLKGAADQLRRPSLGVPESTAEHSRTALTALAAALDAAISCKQTHLAATACESTMSLVRERADALGRELVGLIPYGTRPASDIGPRPGSPGSSS
jgi:hypothetical protein